jgi:uncharacterized protein involved in response to NO
MTEREPSHIVASEKQHAEFRPGFIWTALGTAIFAGFAIGGHLAFVIGFGFPLKASFPSMVQAHGHAQLIGWAGLFVIGTSLHFIPRLSSVPLPHQRWIGVILWLVGIGLLLRVFGQPALPYFHGGPGLGLLRWMMAASGALEEAGILLYVLLLITTLRGTGDMSTQPAFGAVRPYFGMMTAGWVLYASVNFFLVLEMARKGSTVVDYGWNEFAIRSFIGLGLLPVAMAHSVRLLPMVLALSAPFWPVRGTAYAYLLGISLELAGAGLPLLGVDIGMVRSLGALGAMLKGGVILWFTWELDLLTRRRPVERPARFLQSGPDRPPTRPGLPDYGEFGRFELLVYSAYTWLVLAAGSEILNGFMALAGYLPPVGEDAVRHMYLVGFITLLIFGVSVRMLPGFLKKKAVASPALVEVTFWLGNIAAVFRVLLLVLPPALLGPIPAIGSLIRGAFGLSGLIALGAVVCLALNLRWTARPAT